MFWINAVFLHPHQNWSLLLDFDCTTKQLNIIYVLLEYLCVSHYYNSDFSPGGTPRSEFSLSTYINMFIGLYGSDNVKPPVEMPLRCKHFVIGWIVSAGGVLFRDNTNTVSGITITSGITKNHITHYIKNIIKNIKHVHTIVAGQSIIARRYNGIIFIISFKNHEQKHSVYGEKVLILHGT